MGCNACDENPHHYPYRIGNKEIGYSAIIISACEAHATYTINILNQLEPQYTRKYHHLIDEAERKRREDEK